MVYRPIPLAIGLTRPLFHLATGWVPSWSMRRHEASEHSFGSRRSSRPWWKCHLLRWENTGKMIKIMAKWRSDVVKCGESLDETVGKIIKEWPELAKEPRNQLSSCIFVFISWSGSRSLHPKPRCWKMLKDLWLCMDCTMSSQNPTISKYHEILIIMIWYVSHYISLYLTVSF